MRFERNQQTVGYRYGRPLADGNYDALVLRATEDISRNGNEMLVLCLGIEGPQGGVRVDYHVVAHFSERVEELLKALAVEHLDD